MRHNTNRSNHNNGHNQQHSSTPLQPLQLREVSAEERVDRLRLALDQAIQEGDKAKIETLAAAYTAIVCSYFDGSLQPSFEFDLTLAGGQA
jgi:hypothetical protein